MIGSARRRRIVTPPTIRPITRLIRAKRRETEIETDTIGTAENLPPYNIPAIIMPFYENCFVVGESEDGSLTAILTTACWSATAISKNDCMNI